MANKFEFRIVALDRFTATFRNLNDRASRAVRPVTAAQRQFSALGREMHLDKIAKGFRGVTVAAERAAAAIGLNSGPMQALFGLGAAGGVLATVAAVGALGARWGRVGFEVTRTSQAIGVSTQDLQRYRGAAKLAGLDQDALTNSFRSLGQALQDAEFGRNPEVLTLMNRFGIGIRRNKQGVVDIVGTYKDLARVISRIGNPQLQERIAEYFGMADSLPLLRQGPEALDKLIRKAEEFGVVASGDALTASEKFALSMARLKVAVEGVADAWGQKLTPALTRGVDFLTDGLTTKSKSRGLFAPLLFPFELGEALGRDDSRTTPADRRASGVVQPLPGSLPLGLRQNNPGNLMVWGKNPVENGFARFATMTDGLNAMAQQLSLYGNRDGLWSISSILNKYAPPSKNDTPAYIASVAKQTGFAPDAALNTNDPKTLASLMSAMVRHEQGQQPFTPQQYEQAAQNVKVEVAFKNAPAGIEARVTDGHGAWMPSRTSLAMPTTTTP